ncbi:MAG: shikimate dehydrogenase [Verrucomicrobiota bacterium]
MELNFKQELVGCFGFPVAENPTQAMIEPAFEALGLDWRYLTLEVKEEDLERAVEGARAFAFQGFNCTIPHKIEVIKYLDGLGESAELMGAVNCVVLREGRLIGENTDGKGFVAALSQIEDPKGKTMVLFGAGGAARAISVEMAVAGVKKIVVVNRGEQRGRDLVDLLRGKVQQVLDHDLEVDWVKWAGDYSLPEQTDIVVNATSIGLYPDVAARLDIDMDTLLPSMVVADVIPNPPETCLVREARQRGCRVIDGLEMLVGQGVIGIQFWTGKSPDANIMRSALEKVFAGED